MMAQGDGGGSIFEIAVDPSDARKQLVELAIASTS